MLLKLNVMHLVVEKRAYSSVTLMLLGKNCDFFSLVFTLMLPEGLLIFSGSPIHYGWFYCHLIGQKTPPRLFLVVAGSFNIFARNPRRDGVTYTDFLLFYQSFTRGAIR